jgi:ribonuclease BN (tRNA processing enzyme)
VPRIPRARVSVRVLGCGDAFGSGGRLHTSFMLDAPGTRLLIDCGTSALIAMHRSRIDPARLDAVVLSHLHGDHFGGLPFLLLDAAFVSRRSTPLLVAGPPGTLARLRRTTEALFPGFWGARGHALVRTITWRDRRPAAVAGATVTPFRVAHESGAPAFAVRVSCGGCTVAYSGDTGWTPSLLAAAEGSDLFICEATSYDRTIPAHLTYAAVARHREAFRTRRLVLTHLGPDMIARSASLAVESLRDGQRIALAPPAAGRRRRAAPGPKTRGSIRG